MATKVWIGNDSGNEGDFDTAANWSPSGVPAAADDLVFDHNAENDLDTGLDQSAKAFGSIRVYHSFAYAIGTEAAYFQADRDTEVHIGEHYGAGSPTGSTRIKISLTDDTSSAGTVTVHDTAATAADTYRMPVQLLLASTGNNVYVRDGKVELAGVDGETSTVADVHVDDGTVVLGEGLTMTNLYVDGGNVTQRCGSTLTEVTGGQWTSEGSGAVTTLTVSGGTARPHSTGTIGTLNVQGGTTDFSGSSEARTVTTTDVWVGGRLRLDPDVVTLTNDPEPQEPMLLTAS